MRAPAARRARRLPRCTHSIHALESPSAGSTWPWQSGQSGQPRPESVARTTTPMTTSRYVITTVAAASFWKRVNGSSCAPGILPAWPVTRARIRDRTVVRKALTRPGRAGSRLPFAATWFPTSPARSAARPLGWRSPAPQPRRRRASLPPTSPTSAPGSPSALSPAASRAGRACATGTAPAKRADGWTATAKAGGLVRPSHLVRAGVRSEPPAVRLHDDHDRLAGQQVAVSVGSPDLTAKVALYDLVKGPDEADDDGRRHVQVGDRGQDRHLRRGRRRIPEAGDWGAEFTTTQSGRGPADDPRPLPGPARRRDAGPRRHRAGRQDARPAADVEAATSSRSRPTRTRTRASTRCPRTRRSPSTSRSCWSSRRRPSARARSAARRSTRSRTMAPGLPGHDVHQRRAVRDAGPDGRLQPVLERRRPAAAERRSRTPSRCSASRGSSWWTATARSRAPSRCSSARTSSRPRSPPPRRAERRGPARPRGSRCARCHHHTSGPGSAAAGPTVARARSPRQTATTSRSAATSGALDAAGHRKYAESRG